MVTSISAKNAMWVWLTIYLVGTFGSAALAKTGLVPGWPGFALFAASFLLLFPMTRAVERAQEASGTKSKAMVRYNRRVIVSSMIYVAALLTGMAIVRYYHPPSAVRVVVAVAVAVPVIFMLRAMALLLKEETDEYLRLLHVRQNLIATGFLLTVATLYGFLNAFDIAPRVDAWAAVPLWALGLGIGAVSNKLTLGSSAGCR
jgi:hypothetical protein